MASAAAPVASQNASAAVSAVADAAAQPGQLGGQPQVGEQVEAVVGRRPVGAHPDPDAPVEHARSGAMPLASLALLRRAVRDGDVVLAPELEVAVVHVHAVRGQHPAAEHVVRGEQRRHREPVGGEQVRALGGGLGDVQVQQQAVLAGGARPRRASTGSGTV